MGQVLSKQQQNVATVSRGVAFPGRTEKWKNRLRQKKKLRRWSGTKKMATADARTAALVKYASASI
jgi:hypothetical protein